VEGGTLSEKEIEKRLPVWCALSDLFLDTELQSTDFDRIAGAIMRSGIGVSQAQQILQEEVAPVFVVNAFSVAGEWAGWPAASVKEWILTYLRSGSAPRAWRSLQARRNRMLYDAAWRQVANRLKEHA